MVRFLVILGAAVITAAALGVTLVAGERIGHRNVTYRATFVPSTASATVTRTRRPRPRPARTVYVTVTVPAPSPVPGSSSPHP